MSLAVILLIIALICFVLAAIGPWPQIKLVPAGLACITLAALIGGAHTALALSYSLQASVLPMAAATSPALDPQTFNIVVAAVIGAGSSYVLKWAPASWKGKPMVIAAYVVAAVLEVAELYITGQLATFKLSDATAILAAIAGQAAFYALLKDDLKLADPPAAIPAGTKQGSG